MKFNCDAFNDWRTARRKSRSERLAEWHERYAWFPIKVGRRDCRWFETVLCRRSLYYSFGYGGWNREHLPLDASQARKNGWLT